MKKTKRELEIRQAAVEHEWPVVFDDIFAEGAEWADSHPNWISVEEKLPNKLEPVLCTNGHDVGVGFYDSDDSGNVLWAAPHMGCFEVTHWMPLPAPPSGSSEKPKNCKKFDIPGYENVVIHEGNAKGGIIKGGKK